MDAYIFQLKDTVPIGSVENIPADQVNGRRLRISGRDLDNVSAVEVNHLIIVDGIRQISKNVLEVDVPDMLQDAVITQIAVLTDTATESVSSRLVATIAGGGVVTGLQYAVQQFLKWLFSAPGSDAWHPEGGGGWKMLSGVYNDGEVDSPVSRLEVGVQNTTQFIQKLQAKDGSLKPSERIASCTVQRIVRTPTSVQVTLHFKTVSGEYFTTQVGAQ